MLTFHYFADVKKTLYDPDYRRSLAQMQQAGVSVLWLELYMAGRYLAEKEEILLAKAQLEALGFAVNAILLPVGHPGNSLNPEEALDLSLPPHWHYRVNAAGEKEYFSACIDDTVIAENKAVVTFCRDAGFAQLFFDDDLRIGNHGDAIRGCYCARCLRAFAAVCGRQYSREALVEAIRFDAALAEMWIAYTCAKVTRFMRETAVPGIQTGIMVMHNGGRSHGIDIPAIREAVPDCLFRVGELHFHDAAFEADVGHASELGSMKRHMALVGDAGRCYSETTVFPPRALSPQNLVKKVELAIGAGMCNIFLMSGTWVMSEAYWSALAEHRDAFAALAAQTMGN